MVIVSTSVTEPGVRIVMDREVDGFRGIRVTSPNPSTTWAHARCHKSTYQKRVSFIQMSASGCGTDHCALFSQLVAVKFGTGLGRFFLAVVMMMGRINPVISGVVVVLASSRRWMCAISFWAISHSHPQHLHHWSQHSSIGHYLCSSISFQNTSGEASLLTFLSQISCVTRPLFRWCCGCSK